MNLTQRPPYSTIDFKALAKADPDFKQTWQACTGKLDFQDPATLQSLSKAILKVDFGLELSLPENRLCPPIPNRWNYVSWIQGLLDSTSPSHSNRYDPDREVVGLDIGTGASGIYAMLCMKSRPNWTMCATDIDKASFESAAANFARNNVLSRTKMLHTTSSMPLIPLEALSVQQLDFTLCNPPFFADSAEMEKSLSGEGKATGPNAICTGSNNEMVCPGGDLGFVTRIVNESLLMRDKVRWYSSMLGKLSSAKAVVELLKSNAVTNWAVGVLDPGTKAGTKRWVVAWSFGDMRPRNSIARPPGGSFPHDLLPFPTSYNISLPSSFTGSIAVSKLNDQLSTLDLFWQWNAATSTGIGEASENVWGRAYRRAYERRKREGQVGMHGGTHDKMIKLAFRITVVDLAGEVVLEWLKGDDQVLWESFCGCVHRWFKQT
ncbi:23S rRNA (adenine(1618)-N(6))-methyltransferase [Ascochyta lentis]